MHQTASLDCQSLFHNEKSPPIIQNNIWNFTSQTYQKDATVLVGGVIVMTQGTKEDGIINCWNAIDEEGGFSNLDTFFIGKILHHSSSHIIKNYFSYKYNVKSNFSSSPITLLA